jgi:hypothetical protein
MKIQPLENQLASNINRHYGQEGLCLVPRSGIWYPLEDIDWPYLMKILKEWEAKGRIKIIANPEKAEVNETCLELLKVPGTDREFPENWIRDRPS